MDFDGKVNIMNDEFMKRMPGLLDRLEADVANIRGVIVTSAKNTFLAGGDLALMSRARRGMELDIFVHFERLKSYLRRLEKLGPPVVALVSGTALGGGYELCLACHHRIALNRDDAQLGLPEIDFGILPAAGGVIRLTHRLGFDKALPWLLQGRRVSLRQAFEEGLVDELADTREDAEALARSWILNNPKPVQPFDAPGRTFGAHRLSSADRTSLQLAPARVRSLGGQSNLAAARIADVAAQSLYLPWELISRIETRGFVELVMSDEAQARIAAFFAPRRELG
jgi:3-hydroxyacyl-CoA dehydrogenase/enoyl-CoA hydratase/3-hydroxybutyryl-CoA epimerase